MRRAVASAFLRLTSQLMFAASVTARMGAFVMSRIPGDPLRRGMLHFANWAVASDACTNHALGFWPTRGGSVG
jgi:hypothetical protein